MKVSFQHEKEDDLLKIFNLDEKYKSLSSLTAWHWRSIMVKEDIEWVKQCKAGRYKSEEGFNAFKIGIENSPGRILVANNGPAWVINGWDYSETYMELELDEVLDFLYQLRDFLISKGL